MSLGQTKAPVGSVTVGRFPFFLGSAPGWEKTPRSSNYM